jgi:hypothetical protein
MTMLVYIIIYNNWLMITQELIEQVHEIRRAELVHPSCLRTIVPTILTFRK